MALIVTSARRRLAMAVVLALAVAGGILRSQAPNPSTLRDIGTLLLVLWLPAVGNFIGYLMGKIPKPAPPPTGFPGDQPFSPQLRVQLERVPLPADFLASAQEGQLGTVLVGRRGFTVRSDRPLGAWLQADGDATLSLELLTPEAGLGHLAPGTEFHLLIGTLPVAKGRVVAVLRG